MSNVPSVEQMQRRISQNPQVLVRTVGTETVLLNLHNEEYFTLDEIGSTMWHFFDGTRTLEQVAAMIVAEYDAEYEQVAQDVCALVDELLTEQLVRVQ